MTNTPPRGPLVDTPPSLWTSRVTWDKTFASSNTTQHRIINTHSTVSLHRWGLTGLLWTVDSSSNLTVAEVMALMMSSHIWPTVEDKASYVRRTQTSTVWMITLQTVWTHTFYLTSVLHLWSLLHLSSPQPRGEREEDTNKTADALFTQTVVLLILWGRWGGTDATMLNTTVVRWIIHFVKKWEDIELRRTGVLLQVLCSADVRTRGLHRATHQMSLQRHRDEQVKITTHCATRPCKSPSRYLCVCRSTGSPQHGYLLLTKLVLTGSHM